ncbi:MAG: DinB family protein [Luteibaculaceae bacterium]
MEKPASTEFASFYEKYINFSAEPLKELYNQLGYLDKLKSLLTEEQASSAYAAGKWTVKELLIHMADTEVIFTYRFLRMVRGDKTPLPGFDQDDYVDSLLAQNLTLVDVIEHFKNIRKQTLSVLRTTPKHYLERGTEMSGNYTSARALLFIMSGHFIHHITILEERYIPIFFPEKPKN